MAENIILLFGGDSAERLVSVASAQTMAQTIDPAKLWFWHVDGRVFETTYNELIDHPEPFTNEFKPRGTPLFHSIAQAIASPSCDDHIFLLAVHGGSGENGVVQELFENHGRPFSGSSAHASRICFDKVLTKEALAPSGICKMAPHVVVVNSGNHDEVASSVLQFFVQHGDIIMKPICGGSSIGNNFIRSAAHVERVVREMSQGEPYIVEKVIRGREITIGVVEMNEKTRGLPPTEILLADNRDFDYEGKYLGQGSREITPAQLPASVLDEAQRLAVLVHKYLGLVGYSRADMILADDGFYFLEINTLPGMSKNSLIPQQLAVAGIPMKDFLGELIKAAVRKI